MKISTRQIEEVLIIDLAGKLDTQTSGPASDEMKKLADGVPGLLLNLENLLFISSAGLRLILQIAKLVRGRDGDLKLCGATGVVREVIEISEMSAFLDIYDNEANALDAF